MLTRTSESGLLNLSKAVPQFHGLLFTQIPSRLEGREVHPGRSRVMLLRSDGSMESLTSSFFQAADPDVSFDGERFLFAGKKKATDFWQVYEMNLDGSGLKQITNEPFDCRTPVYQSTMYVITSTLPWNQITFLGTPKGKPSALYSCRMDGSALRQLTFTPYGTQDPFIMQDGRVLYAAWQRDRGTPSWPERRTLFTINSDGTDVVHFGDDRGSRFKESPIQTNQNLVVFVESEEGSMSQPGGRLAAVSLRRSVHSHRYLSAPADGKFRTPAPLPNGEILVSNQSGPGFQTFGLYRLNPYSGELSLLKDDPAFHEIQPKLIASRPMPDGRSSVVNESVKTGELFCQDIKTTTLSKDEFDPKLATHMRVIEGRPEKNYVERYLLGKVAIETDGSFNIRVPANTPIQLEALNAQGQVLRSCQWIWVKNKEPRGCIGCHEDAERTPENVMSQALWKDSVNLLPLKSQRRRLSDQGRRTILKSLQKGGK